jgi:hypothetical protein
VTFGYSSPSPFYTPSKNYFFNHAAQVGISMICRIPSGLRCVVDVARRALPFPDMFKLCGCILICRPAARPHSGGDAELRQQPGLEKNPHGNGNDQNPDGIHKHLPLRFLYISGSGSIRNHFITRMAKSN